MKSLVKVCSKILEIFASVTLLVLTVMVFVNVILRYFFNSGITATEELGRFFFVWLVFAGAVLAAGTDSHVKVDFVVAKLSAAGRKVIAVLGDALMVFICGLITVGGYKQGLVNMDNESPITKLPLSWMYFAGMTAGALIGLIILVRLVGRLMGGDCFGPMTEKGATE